MKVSSNCSFSFEQQSGLSLVEVMIAMVIFTMLALGITGTIIQSQRIAQNNILRNTAYTVVQGYLEQIKTLNVDQIEGALAEPSSVPLETRSISALASGTDTQIDDFLYLDGFNAKTILIDLQERSGHAPREVTMNLWVDIDILTGVNEGARYYTIVIDFDYDVRGMRRPATREEDCWIRSEPGVYEQETRTLSGTGRLYSLRLTKSALNETHKDISLQPSHW